jgi:hypothetical protein
MDFNTYPNFSHTTNTRTPPPPPPNRLLLRFYDPQSGGVFIDGCNIRHATQSSVRAAIAVVPQVGAGWADWFGWGW